MKVLTFAMLAATLATPVLAGSIRNDDRFEQQLIEEARRDHARAIGGYNDPITAFRNLLAGELTEKDVGPGINTLFLVPKYQALQGDTVEGVKTVGD